MPGDDILKTANREQRRLIRVLKSAGIRDEKVATLRPVIENTALMYAKLEEIRAEIADAPIIVEYDNGGGQSGIRENPLFKGYEALWKAYMLGMGRLIDQMPAETAKEEKKAVESGAPGTVLDLVMARRRRDA